MVGIDEYRAGFAAHEAGYLDYAAVGPLSEVARAEEQGLVEVLMRARFGAIDQARADVARARSAIAAITGFDAEHIVDQPNTGTGLMHAVFALSGGVMVSRREFPALPYAVQRAQQALGRVQPLWLDPADGRVTPELVRDNLSVDVDAVAVSLVDYRTGYVADLAGIRDVIGDRLLIVDAIQGLGVVDADFSAADVIAGGGHKWLRAGRGTGYLAFSDFALDRMRPIMSGLNGSADPQNWDEVLEPAPGADAYRISLPDVVGQVRLAAALEEIVEVGVPAIAEAIAERAERVLEIADEAGIPVTSPRERGQRAGIIMLSPGIDEAGHLGAALHNAGVSVTVRGGGVRVSVHAGTSNATLDQLRFAVAEYSTASAGRVAAQTVAAPAMDSLADGFIVLGAQVVVPDPAVEAGVLGDEEDVADAGADAGGDAVLDAGLHEEVAADDASVTDLGDPEIGETVTVTATITLPRADESEVSDETAPVTVVRPVEGGLETLTEEALEPRAASDVRMSGDDVPEASERAQNGVDGLDAEPDVEPNGGPVADSESVLAEAVVAEAAANDGRADDAGADNAEEILIAEIVDESTPSDDAEQTPEAIDGGTLNSRVVPEP